MFKKDPVERTLKLAELYWLAKSPWFPLFSERGVAQIFPELAGFLEKQFVTEPAEPTEPTIVPSLAPLNATRVLQLRANRERREAKELAARESTKEPASRESPKGSDAANENPGTVIETPNAACELVREVQLPGEPYLKKRKLAELLTDPEFLDPHILDTHTRENTLVCVSRDHVPHQFAPRDDISPLAELYYLTQTLPLLKLIPGSQKALTTETYEKALLEGKIAVVYSRIEELKRMMRWSLRQPEKFRDPLARDATRDTHWAALMREALWLAVDVHEQRKMQLAVCHMKAQAVMDYWSYGRIMCVRRSPIKHLPESKDTVSPEIDSEMVDADKIAVIAETPETEIDSGIDVFLLTRPDPMLDIVPPVLPEITREDFQRLDTTVLPFKVSVGFDELNGVSQKIVDSLSTFNPFDARGDDAYARMPVVAISKLLSPLEEADDGWYKVYMQETRAPRAAAARGPQKGLFGVSNKRALVLRPPKPPALKYLDLRTPTIWLPQDDKYLIHYVAEYQFNWGIIAANLAARATHSYAANIERRTPWQCFERYIQLNDKFQFGDMKGVHAFSAQRWLEAAHKAQTNTKRRISPLGVGNESIQRGHRRLRWASMFEAMRKCMRKRENTPKPNNTSRKLGGDDKNNGPVPTPAELAKLKYERDKAIQEAYLQQQSLRNPPVAQAPAVQVPVTRVAVPAPRATPLPVARPPAKLPSGRNPNVPTTPNGTPYTAEQLQYLMRYQKQRKLLAQQGARVPAANSNVPAVPNAIPNAVPNANSPVGNSSNVNSPVIKPAAVPVASPVAGVANVAGTRVAPPPRLNLSTAQVSAIVSQIQQQNPNMSNDQIRKLAAQYISQINNNRMKAYAASQANQPSQQLQQQQLLQLQQLQQQQLIQQQQQLQNQSQKLLMQQRQQQQQQLKPAQQAAYEQRKKMIFQKQQQVQQAAAAIAKLRQGSGASSPAYSPAPKE
ncbi:hypothetical protein BABINDRAFT_9506 [Babjeviella inositovora NRRL Y-12698]|uniref:Chromatin modification-related protein EAF1 n=1 Tax=Babjeviella inositovora NRRL Y-12698 TaxID=984486 RepID=A0A1E3QKR8_9ASCO|nr:uncharacterized protein BABINDRAFT_9506 [Babjeviella inositovora NRRL Y-12698]ODQ78296.1 hypothetical protein BABINDRAFT_9506 [Babjeviella inositovora NRRL Y-12698]